MCRQTINHYRKPRVSFHKAAREINNVLFHPLLILNVGVLGRSELLEIIAYSSPEQWKIKIEELDDKLRQRSLLVRTCLNIIKET